MCHTTTQLIGRCACPLLLPSFPLPSRNRRDVCPPGLSVGFMFTIAATAIEFTLMCVRARCDLSSERFAISTRDNNPRRLHSIAFHSIPVQSIAVHCSPFNRISSSFLNSYCVTLRHTVSHGVTLHQVRPPEPVRLDARLLVRAARLGRQLRGHERHARGSIQSFGSFGFRLVSCFFFFCSSPTFFAPPLPFVRTRPTCSRGPIRQKQTSGHRRLRRRRATGVCCCRRLLWGHPGRSVRESERE